jgi:hypothetical protein
LGTTALIVGFPTVRRDIDDLGTVTKAQVLSRKNKDQTMGYLEALRRHLPDGVFPVGFLCNLQTFVFYISTGYYEFMASAPTSDPYQISLYLFDLFRRATDALALIPFDSPSRQELDVTDPKPGALSRAAASPAAGGSSQNSTAAHGVHGGTAAGSPPSHAGGDGLRLTAASLARHDAELVAAARRRLLPP